MKRVGFSITYIKGKEVITYAKGVGYLSEENDLMFAMVTKEGKPYIKIFEKVDTYCREQRDGSKCGLVEICRTVKMPVLDKSGNDTGTTQDVELTTQYRVWYTEK